MRFSWVSPIIASCVAVALCAVPSIATASSPGTASMAGAVALDGTVNAGPSYSTINFTFAAVQNSALPATALPWGLAARGASGYARQNVPGNRTDAVLTVDTIGADGNRACFSGLGDWGAPYGLERYVVCVVDGGVGSADQWYSRWDYYGPTLLTHPVTSGDLVVRGY